MRRRLLVIASSALALAYLLPNHYPPWAAFHADLLTGIAFAPLILWALWQRQKTPALAVGVMLLSLVPLAQVAAKEISFSGDGWMAWLYLTGFALAVLSGDRYVKTQNGTDNSLDQLTPLWTCFVVASLVSVGIAVHQWVDLQVLGLFILEIKPGSRPYANLAQPNQLATLLMLGLAGTAFLYENRSVRGVFALISAVALVFGLAVTQSRTPLLALCLVWVGFLGLRRRAALRMPMLALLFISFVYLVIFVNWQSLNDALLLSGTESLEARMGENLRLVLWRSMIDAIGRAPWIGYGWNQTGLAQQATALDHPATRYFFDSAHNLILDLSIWNGLPIAILVVGGLLLWFKRQILSCSTPLAWCLLMAVGFVFCHAMVEYPISYAYFLLPLGFIMGALGNSGHDVKTRWRMMVPRWGLVSVGAVALMMFIGVAVEYPSHEENWRNVRFGKRGMSNERSEGPSHVILLNQLQNNALFFQMEPTAGMTSEELEWMRRVSERYGWASSNFKYAEALALNGQPRAAEVVLAKMCKTQPPNVCLKALDEWRVLAKEKYIEFRQVELPVVAK